MNMIRNFKLSREDAALIRQLIAERERLYREARELSNAKIAEKFGVHECQISRIAGGRIWKIK